MGNREGALGNSVTKVSLRGESFEPSLGPWELRTGPWGTLLPRRICEARVSRRVGREPWETLGKLERDLPVCEASLRGEFGGSLGKPLGSWNGTLRNLLIPYTLALYPLIGTLRKPLDPGPCTTRVGI